MFGIGANELLIILLFGFIIFGPDKLPGMAKTIGQAIAKFRNAQAEMSKVIKTEVYDPDAEDPFKNPLDAISKLEDQVTKEDRGESFTQRKARYDKQRAARKAAEARKAELAAKKEAEAAAVAAAAVQETHQSTETGAPAELQEEAHGAKPTADELFDVAPKAKAPRKAPSKAQVAAAKKEAESSTTSVSSEPIEKEAIEAKDAHDNSVLTENPEAPRAKGNAQDSSSEESAEGKEA